MVFHRKARRDAPKYDAVVDLPANSIDFPFSSCTGHRAGRQELWQNDRTPEMTVIGDV